MKCNRKEHQERKRKVIRRDTESENKKHQEGTLGALGVRMKSTRSKTLGMKMKNTKNLSIWNKNEE